LSKEEALAVIRHAANVKHRAMLALVYGSGLRVSEISKLTLADIVRDKLRVKITQSKGAKDRYIILLPPRPGTFAGKSFQNRDIKYFSQFSRYYVPGRRAPAVL
jgi:integrase